ARADVLLDHGGRHPDRDVREARPSIRVRVSLAVELGAASDECPLPFAIRIHETRVVLRRKAVRARDPLGELRGFVEELLSLGVGLERLAPLEAAPRPPKFLLSPQ